MATMPAFFRRTESFEASEREQPARYPAERDLCQLRALPHEDVYFYCKRIDNSRLVREADPRSRGACWSTIGAAAGIVALLTTALVPRVGNMVAGYRLEELRKEQRGLVDERRGLELREAELLSPARLEKYAKEQDLSAPSPNQMVRLDGKGESAVAMVKK